VPPERVHGILAERGDEDSSLGVALPKLGTQRRGELRREVFHFEVELRRRESHENFTKLRDLQALPPKRDLAGLVLEPVAGVERP